MVMMMTMMTQLPFFGRYLLIFLKFMQAVIPTIEYDFTQNFVLEHGSWSPSFLAGRCLRTVLVLEPMSSVAHFTITDFIIIH